MITLATYSVENILPMIGLGKPKISLETKFGTYKVKASSSRLECLRRNQICVWCKRKGNVFALEAHKVGFPKVQINCFIENCHWCFMRIPVKEAGTMDPPHLNLYSRTRRGMILMTQDHIHPRSAGGSNKIENLQTMCRNCNSRKGSYLPEEVPIIFPESWNVVQSIH